jgi:PAS domain S-box-containing protein
VLKATDAEAGLTLAREGQPDLILMDIQLPGMDGLQATVLLKKDEATRNIPVIALTALVMKGDQERILAVGCDGYIAKPMRYREFLATVAEHLASRGACRMNLTQLLDDISTSTEEQPALILVVDDEHQNRQLLELLLKPEGFEVATANSGADALASVARRPPDLMLLDVMMPDMDGCVLAAALKSNPRTQHIPIIMVTALDNREARMIALRAGAEDFLTKPVDRAELCVRVRNLLRLKAYGTYYDKYSHTLEREVVARTTELVARTKLLESQAVVLSEQAALLDLASDAIIVRDMDHRIVFWSRGAEAMYGWPGAEVMGQEARALLRTEFPAPVEEIDRKVLEDGHWAGEVIHHRRDGTSLNVSTRWALQRDGHGNPMNIMAINSDITPRKVAEAERVLLTEKLALANAEQLRFKDEFISHVSHELRSPLTAIKQFSTILHGGLAGELTADQREYQGIVLKNVGQLQAMIDDLLEVTRLETGKLSIETERVSVAEAVLDVCNTLKGTAAAKRVTLFCNVPQNLPPVSADPTRLRQLLIILIENAIKFTPAPDASTSPSGSIPRMLNRCYSKYRIRVAA